METERRTGTVALRLDPTDYRWIQELCERHHLTKSQVIRNLLTSVRLGITSPLLKDRN